MGDQVNDLNTTYIYRYIDAQRVNPVRQLSAIRSPYHRSISPLNSSNLSGHFHKITCNILNNFVIFV